jgi:hypothetical protein
MSAYSPEARGGGRTSGPSWTYTRTVGSFAHRVTSFVMAFALSGSPAVLSACMALCLDSPVAANTTDVAKRGHDDHAAVTEPAATSPHAHHGTAASPQPVPSVANPSQLAPSDARLVGTCDNCCLGGPVAFAAGPGVERADGKAFAIAPTAAVTLFQLSVAAHDAGPLRPPVPPPSPTRAPLALRI